MGRRPKWGRPVTGVLLLNKAVGMTSNHALQQAKRLFFAQRAGHTGSLDPLATGVLPVCFGEATKFSRYLLEADKTYLSTFRFGVTTNTGDCDGETVHRQRAPALTEKAVVKAIKAFCGDIQQVPSMYSALKYQGKPLYRWAREGVTLPLAARQPRQITIYHYELLDFRPGDYPEADVSIHCSKGTYVRTLAEDLGKALNVGAHVIRLHRQGAGSFHDAQTYNLPTLDKIRGDNRAEVLDRCLLPADALLQSLPQIVITDDMGRYFLQGQPVMQLRAYRQATEGDMVRVCLESGAFLGVGVLCEGSVAPKRIVTID